jgi:hypothetical protein
MLLVRRISALALTGVLVLGAACSNDDDTPTGPTVATVAGNYRATTFTATSSLGSLNVLQSGGSLTANFDAAGTLTGHVTIPTESVDEDFTGTWKLVNGEVEIDQVPTDIFIQDVTFKIVANTLVGDETFNGVRCK